MPSQHQDSLSTPSLDERAVETHQRGWGPSPGLSLPDNAGPWEGEARMSHAPLSHGALVPGHPCQSSWCWLVLRPPGAQRAALLSRSPELSMVLSQDPRLPVAQTPGKLRGAALRGHTLWTQRAVWVQSLLHSYPWSGARCGEGEPGRTPEAWPGGDTLALCPSPRRAVAGHHATIPAPMQVT